MPDLLEGAGRLLISQSPGQTRIEGIVGADPALMQLVGTVKEASAIILDDVDKLERAIVAATQSGTRVMDGYVKFAQPIVINGPKQIGTTKQAAAGIAKLDDLGLMDFIEKLAHIESLEDTDCIEKAAACDFVNNWINQVELDKVDGNEVGLTVPVKVAFSDDRAKDWFLSLFKKQAAGHAKVAAAASLVEALVERGVKAADVLDRLNKTAGRRKSNASKK